MAKKKPEGEAKKDAQATTTALAEQRQALNTAMAVADGADKNDNRGKEEITKDDVTLPMIKLCQNNSPEKDEDDPKHLEDLEEGDLFNNVTQQIYGRGPLTFAIIRLNKRAMQFKIGPDGKRTKEIVDYDVPWDDERCEFTSDANNNRVKPIATRFYDYLVFLPDTWEAAILSMSNTKFPVGKKLNSMMALRPGAAWLGLYQLGVAKEEKNGNKYFNYTVKMAGKATPEMIAQAESIYNSFAGVAVKGHEEAVDDDPDAPGDAQEPVDGKKTPF